MTKGPDVRELLSALQPPPKPRSEKWAKVEEYLREIYAARDRRVPWEMIAKTLAVDGIEVRAVELRAFIAKIKRDPKKYGKPLVTRKSRTTVARKAGRTSNVDQLGTALEASSAPPEVAPDEASSDPAKVAIAETSSHSSEVEPAAAPALQQAIKPSDFAGIRRLHARK